MQTQLLSKRVSWWAVAATLTLALLLLAGARPPSSAARVPTPAHPGLPAPASKHYHGCGSLVVPPHPWVSSVAGAPDAWGDHWITDWEGSRGSCRFAKAQLRALISRGGLVGQAKNPSHFRGGLCGWRLGDRFEKLAPFQDIVCVLPMHIGRRTYRPSIEALVDPDPRFIHQGAPGS